MASNISARAMASCSFCSTSQADAGAHPGDVGPGAEGRSVAHQDDGSQSVGRLLGQAVEGPAEGS